MVADAITGNISPEATTPTGNIFADATRGQAVADALSLLANLVMAWNTMNMQLVLDRWNTRRSTTVPPELIGRIAPTRTEGINLCGVFSFPGGLIAVRPQCPAS
jgi:hypothetical protein